jgi:hypothetical protein
MAAASSSLIGLRGVGPASPLPQAGRQGLSALEAAHHPAIKSWLARSPQITLLVHPDQWVVAEHGRGRLDHHRQTIRRESFGSVKELITPIRRFIDGWNERCHPLVLGQVATGYSTTAAQVKETSFMRH